MLAEGTWSNDYTGQTLNYLSKGQKVHVITLGNAFRIYNIVEVHIWTVIHSSQVSSVHNMAAVRKSEFVKCAEKREENQKVTFISFS